MLLTEVVLNVGRENVTGDTDGILLHDTAEGDDGDFGRTASDVHYHVALRGLHVEADTQGRCHRLEDKVDVAASGVLGRVADGTDLNFGGT